MMRPEGMDALSWFHRQMAAVETSTWETIRERGGTREQVVEWFTRWTGALLLLIAGADESNPTELAALTDALNRLLDALERLGIGFEEVADVTLMPPPSLN